MFITTSCYDFLNVNKDPNNPTTLTVDQALPPILFYAAQLTYDHAEYGVYLAQALTTTGNLQTGSLAYSSGWEFLNMNRHPQWRRHFFDIGMNNLRMMEAAEELGAMNYVLIGRTIRLLSTMLTTDAFGDMPHSEAFFYTSPRYDTQESIYEWMFAEADELIRLYSDDSWINAPGNLPITQRIDRIYSGDLAKWGAFTKALRARLWIRKLPNWQNTPDVANRIVEMVDEVLANPNWQEPRYYYPGGVTESNNPWGPAKMAINAWESRPNRLDVSVPTRFFAAILGTYHSPNPTRRFALDPRAERLMHPRDRAGNVVLSSEAPIRFLESNIGMDVDDRVIMFPDLYADQGATGPTNPFTQNTGYIALMLHEELLFIKAEAQYWAGNVTGAFETTRDAVLYNMRRLGVTGSDGSDLTGAERTRFDRFFEVRLPGPGVFTIADVMQQKFVAMYLQPEQWTDMRRYNHSSSTNGITYNGVEIYTITRVHRGAGNTNLVSDFTATYALRRPFNLFTPYWMTPENFGANAPLSPNAWVHRLNYDPETEERYNARELERLGAFRNPDWLRRRMIWARNDSGVANSANDTEWK